MKTADSRLWFTVFMTLSVAVFLLASCSGDGQTTPATPAGASDGEAPPTSEPTAQPTEDSEQVPIATPAIEAIRVLPASSDILRIEPADLVYEYDLRAVGLPSNVVVPVGWEILSYPSFPAVVVRPAGSERGEIVHPAIIVFLIRTTEAYPKTLMDMIIEVTGGAYEYLPDDEGFVKPAGFDLTVLTRSTRDYEASPTAKLLRNWAVFKDNTTRWLLKRVGEETLFVLLESDNWPADHQLESYLPVVVYETPIADLAEADLNTVPDAPLPLGSVVRVVEQGCPDTFGEQCLEAVVVCPGIADATVAIRTTGSGTRGTVILTTDGVGAGGYRIIVPVEGGEYVNGMMDSLLADGFKLVEIIWPRPGVWEGPGGSISLACRPATVFQWVQANIHEGGFLAAQGNSGGSAQIAFALAYYGTDEILDLANLASGPPPCPISSDGVLNSREQDPCVFGTEPWPIAKEPLLTGNPRLHYPNTIVRFFIGKDDAMVALRNTASTYHAAITSETTLQDLAGVGHSIKRSALGAEALLASIREAQQRP